MLLIQDIASQHAHFLGVQLYRLRQSAGIQSATIKGQTSELVGGCSLTDFLAGAALLESQFVVNLKREHDDNILSVTDMLWAHLQKLTGEFDAHHSGINNWWSSGLGEDSEGEPTIYGIVWQDIYSWHDELLASFRISEETVAPHVNSMYLKDVAYRIARDDELDSNRALDDNYEELNAIVKQLSLIQQRGQQCFWEIAAWARRLNDTFRKAGQLGTVQENFHRTKELLDESIAQAFKKLTPTAVNSGPNEFNPYMAASHCAELNLTGIRNDVATFVHLYGEHELSAQESRAIYSSHQ